MQPQNFFGNEIWRDVLEADPMGRQSIFQAMMPQGFSPVQQESASNLFQPAFSTYLGQYGRELAEVSRGEREQEPTSFTDFISNQYDFRRNLLRQPEAGGGRQNLLGFRTQFGY
tara:strand:- start:1803 stop:2144 length:342 start_codon:yes stop_codon:yes gene_type:complete